MEPILNKSCAPAIAAVNQMKDKAMPMRFALRIAKFAHKLDQHMRDLDKASMALAEKYGERDEEGELIRVRNADGSEGVKIRDDVSEEFETEYSDLMDAEWENPPTLLLSGMETLDVSPALVYVLALFLVEDEAEQQPELG